MHLMDVHGNTATNGDPRQFSLLANLEGQPQQEVLNGDSVRRETACTGGNLGRHAWGCLSGSRSDAVGQLLHITAARWSQYERERESTLQVHVGGGVFRLPLSGLFKAGTYTVVVLYGGQALSVSLLRAAPPRQPSTCCTLARSDSNYLCVVSIEAVVASLWLSLQQPIY